MLGQKRKRKEMKKNSEEERNGWEKEMIKDDVIWLDMVVWGKWTRRSLIKYF